MSYRPTEAQARQYPNRVLVEWLCQNCGTCFSSIKPSPTYCSHECYIEDSRERTAARAQKLWRDPEFVAKIQRARRDAGYPDTNRPEAVARRRLRASVKSAIHRCLAAGATKAGSTFEVLGYTPEQLRLHLESLFAPGMTWANYGEWEIDHKRPISNFPVGTSIMIINALSNLQPLWAQDDRSKHNHVI